MYTILPLYIVYMTDLLCMCMVLYRCLIYYCSEWFGDIVYCWFYIHNIPHLNILYEPCVFGKT